MKKLVLNILLVFYGLCLHGQVPFPCRTMQNSSFQTYSQNTGTKLWKANCWEVIDNPSNLYDPVIIENDAKITVKANSSINLRSGFQARNFTNGGYFHATLSANSIEPMIINLPSNVVGKHKKFEIGFKMPDDIEDQVKNYLADPGNFIGLNPYDPDKIDIEGIFTSPTGNIQKRFGFYYEYYQKNISAPIGTPPPYGIASGLIEKTPDNPDMYKWRVRFAPDEIGNWSCYINIKINGTLYQRITNMSFECISSNEHGYLKVGQHKRQFIFSDDNTSFFAIGQNLPWPKTLKYVHYNLNVTNNFQQNYSLEGGTEEWLHFFKNLGDNAGNFARTVFYMGDDMDNLSYAGGQEIEWEKLGDYQSRQHVMFVLDEVFDIAEDKGIFILLTPNIQNEFSDKWSYSPYLTSSFKNNQNPYKPFGVVTPVDFINNTIAQQFYKRKLRYIHSRWGYGPHLAAYEICSEMNGWQDFQANKYYYSVWSNTMHDYQKVDLGARQLFSTSYSGAATHDAQDEFSPFESLDFTCQHSYGNPKHQSIKRLQERQGMLSSYDKPSNFGEMGMTNPQTTTINGVAGIAEADPNDYQKCDGTEWHNAFWATAFMTGYGAGINWYAEDRDDYRANNYPAMKQFFSNVNFETDQWTENQHWSNDIFEALGPKYAATREVFAMTTQSSHKAMGWVHQATNWWGNKKTITNCHDRHDLAMPVTNTDWNDDETAPLIDIGNFQLTGLIPWTQYQVNFYRTDDGAGQWYSTEFVSSNILGLLSPSYPATPTNPDASGVYFDFSFKASKSGINFRSSGNETNNYKGSDTLACGTRSVKIKYIWYGDSLGLFKYEWSW